MWPEPVLEQIVNSCKNLHPKYDLEQIWIHSWPHHHNHNQLRYDIDGTRTRASVDPKFRSKSTTQIWIWSWIQIQCWPPKNWLHRYSYSDHLDGSICKYNQFLRYIYPAHKKVKKVQCSQQGSGVGTHINLIWKSLRIHKSSKFQIVIQCYQNYPKVKYMPYVHIEQIILRINRYRGQNVFNFHNTECGTQNDLWKKTTPVCEVIFQIWPFGMVLWGQNVEFWRKQRVYIISTQWKFRSKGTTQIWIWSQIQICSWPYHPHTMSIRLDGPKWVNTGVQSQSGLPINS